MGHGTGYYRRPYFREWKRHCVEAQKAGRGVSLPHNGKRTFVMTGRSDKIQPHKSSKRQGFLGMIIYTCPQR
ncbi:hypothetical protein M406DRAFT_53602 [Cryphonectria parasitica EP155]|uniref:Uncharacterized protein n=1 Tax=Cryphonectria parasitica (strain ATCC 38755 / EP155) TaxID=660469 RepID=A0A9P5CU89_CRYP1|nr:uncharacterized protein M406DRAFT_53602 [Cryphonectria parasitica EP155]KAF3769895.1 hypothetical protein M406DRAFT_53602 [Cryphonectria parasitica EP155]